MELLIKNIQQKDKEDFEGFLDNYAEKLMKEYKQEIGKSKMWKAASWAGKRVGIDASMFLEMTAAWTFADGVYHFVFISPVENLPNFKQMLVAKLEKELQRIRPEVKIELGKESEAWKNIKK